jgi:hypothetical protein
MAITDKFSNMEKSVGKWIEDRRKSTKEIKQKEENRGKSV